MGLKETNQEVFPTGRSRLFEDLRERNEYARRVAQMRREERDRRVEQVVQVHRRHHLDQAR